MNATADLASPDSVLQQYLELCSSDIARLGYHLASNAVLEWNGVTHRGSSRILKFLRQKVHAGFEQNFPTASRVEPFDGERDTHLATKATPPENLVQPAVSPVRAEANASSERSSAANFPPRSQSEEEDESPGAADPSYATPPRTLPAIPHPPAPTGGRQFLPFPSDDEEEDDEPPGSLSAGRSSPRQNAYSELQYLEAAGLLRTVNEPKHRGTRTTHHIPRDGTPPSGSSATQVQTPRSSDELSEKRTKLKISYRTHRHTHEVQFALIIYEHIPSRSSTVRRNLFCEEQTESHPASPQPPVSGGGSPELIPLPDSPPAPDAAVQEVSPPRTPIQPPGTPIKRRRVPPVLVGMRSSPRRVRLLGDGDTVTSSSSIQQTWPRKHPSSSSTSGGGPPGKSRLLAPGSSSIRKPLRF